MTTEADAIRQRRFMRALLDDGAPLDAEDADLLRREITTGYRVASDLRAELSALRAESPSTAEAL